MSELRVSTTQPQSPAFQPKDAPKATTPKAPKVEATKATPTKSPQSLKNAQGKAIRCMVKMGSTQCQNPGRWPHGKAVTCTTHHKHILKGAKVTFTFTKAVVNQSLWTGK